MKIDLEKTKDLDILTQRISRMQKRLYLYQEAIREGSVRDIQLSSGETMMEALNVAEAALDCIMQDFYLWVPEDVEYTTAEWIEQN